MSEVTTIEWTNTIIKMPVMWKGELTCSIPGATFNPWWGCHKVSRACKNCYAETFANRFNKNLWGPNSDRKFFGDKHWNEPLKWNAECEKLGIKRKVFCASMADVFEDRPDLVEPRKRLFRLIEDTPNLIWLLLTKRPENILQMLPEKWNSIQGPNYFYKTPSNIWFGVTVEDQITANERLPEICLVKTHTDRIVFLSMEPLCGSVDLEQCYFPRSITRNVPVDSRTMWLHLIDLVIVGGESGPKAVPLNPRHVIDIFEQCTKYKVKKFFKQWGEFMPIGIPEGDCTQDTIKYLRMGKKASGRRLFGKEFNEMPEI